MNTAQNTEMDKIEGEQPKCNFTINVGEAGDAAPSRLFFEPQVTKTK
jgi:hypothetical protein